MWTRLRVHLDTAWRTRNLSTSGRLEVNVTVLGATGSLGRPLCLLLKQNPKIKRLNLYGVRRGEAMADDLAHINTATRVRAFVGTKMLQAALSDADIVALAAGHTRLPGM